MANFAALKGFFSKLKPAAKTVANYGDDVAKAVANYGDDAAKALTNSSNRTRVGDLLENAYADQRIFRIPEEVPDKYLDDVYLASSGKSYVAHKDPVTGVQMLTPNAMLNVDSGARRGNVPSYAHTLREGTPHTWAMRKDGDYEFPVPIADASFDELTDPFTVEKLDGIPDLDAMDIRPERFGWFNGGHEKAYEDALSQGFISADILPHEYGTPDLIEINKYLDTLGDPYTLPKSYGRYSVMPSYNTDAPIERLYDELLESDWAYHPLEKSYYDQTLQRAYQHSGRRAQEDFVDFFESGAYLEPDSYYDFDDNIIYDPDIYLSPEESAALEKQYIKDRLEFAMFGKKGPRKSPLV